ncbi:hypothetical protein DMUE_1786 [Dictyocoela muelleri]|nr:hypothetical protein DMUE_1786 [Dictyocoela muelleri]
MCIWKEEVLAVSITQIFNLNIQHRIGTEHSSEEFFAKICELKYNKAASIKYFEQLTNIRQDDSITIKAYYNKIQEVSQKLGIFHNFSYNIVQIKIEIVIRNGLAKVSS